MAESFVEKRRRELGLTSPTSTIERTPTSTISTEPSFVERRKMELGLIPDTRPKMAEKISAGKLPSFDVTQSPLMKTIQAQPATPPPPTYLEHLKSLIPTKEQLAGVFNLPTAQKAASTILSTLGRPSQVIAEYATPNAPLIGELPGGGYGEIPGTNARQAFLARTGQKPATGLGEKALGMVAAPFAVPGAGLGTGAELSQVAKQTLERLAPKLAPSLGGKVIQGAAVGAPIGAGTELATGTGNLKEAAISGAVGAGLGAAFPLVGAGLGTAAKAIGGKIGSALERLRASRAASPIDQQAEENIQSIISQPSKPIPSRLQPLSGTQTLDRVMSQIKPIVTERMTPPLENPNELAKWVRSHLGTDISLNEVRKVPYEDLRQLAEEIKGSISVYNTAVQVAKRRGFDLPTLLEGKVPSIGQTVTRQAQERVAGIYPTELPTVQKPQFTAQKEYEAINSRLNDIDRPSLARTLTSEQQANEIVNIVSQPRIRDRVYNFLDEAEQAARERIKARRYTGFVPAGGNEAVDWTIIGAAKLGKGTIKAADWTEEMVKEFGEDFRKHAPRIYKASQIELKNQVRKASKEGQEAAAFNESGTGDASTFRNKISYKAADQKEPFINRIEKAYSQFVDDVTAFAGLEKRVTGQVASAEKSLYKAARLFKGMPEKANLFVRDRLGSVINNAEKQGISTQDLGEYALAVHARDVNNAGYKSGMTNAEIDDVINKYGSDAMENSRKELVKVNDDLLEELIKSDVISRESADIMRQKFPNYIPLFRAFDDKSVEFGSGLSQALANVASPIKKLKGSERAVINPLENMVKNIFQSINAAERNKVARQLDSLAKLDTEGQYIRKLAPDEQVGRKNVVNVKINGENIKYEVEPEVYKTFFNMDQQSGNLLTDILSAPASILRAGATLTPEFALRNPFRDIPTAYVTSESGFTPFDFFYGLGSAIRGKQGKEGLYKEWINNLGSYGQSLSMDRDAYNEALKTVLKQTPTDKLVNIVNGKGLISLLRSISDTTEAATKIGEFRAALRTGATPAEATYRARDLMDFARAGSAIRPTNRMVAFLNANIQGKDKLVRSFKRDKLGTTIRSLKAVTLPTVAIFAAQKYLANDVQKNTIKEAPDWQKDAFWLIPVPGTNIVARMPKPFDLAPVFSNSVEKALEFYYNNDKDAFDGFFKRSLDESSLPVQLTGLMPLIEGMSNYSFFRQGPIIPQREAGLSPSEQYDPIRTTETGKFLAKMVEKATGAEGQFKNFASPRIMDNTIQGITAGLGGYATSAIDSIVQGKAFGKKILPAIVERPEAPEKRLEQKPFIKAFTVDQLQGGRSTEAFYKELDKLKTEKATNKQKGVTFGKETSKKDYYLPKEKEKLLDEVTKSAERISEIGTEIRLIEKDSKLTGSQKRIKIEPLIKERINITQKEAQRLKQARE